jgi:hypothetical protein
MTTEKPLEMCSDEERRSFLVPCYGFEQPEEAENYWRSPNFAKENRIFGPGDAFAPIFRGRWAYVPRMSARYGKWLTTELVANEFRNRGSKPIWEVLRTKDTPKPSGSYNVVLLVEGRRQFFRCHRQTTKHPKWWYGIADGDKDCFAVWGRKDNPELSGAMVVDASTRVYAARSGRGVIYARETEFDNSGKPLGFRTELVRVEFSILDRDPAKDDMLRVQLFQQISWSNEPYISDDLDPVWVALIERARAGFEHWCKPVQPKVEEWRQFFVGQREKAEADRRDYSGASFADRVEKADWQEALRAVKEPWQLAVVASRHGRRAEFSSDGGVYTIPYETVPEMIRRHDCSEERRAELMQMIADYVAPSDNLWNYRGD